VRKTVIYSRQSLDAEKQKNSTGVQKDKCLELAKKKGYLVHDYYNEGERSARITGISGRPELVRLLHAAEQGEVERVIVYKRDRLARNVEQYMEILTRFLKAKVEILFAADNEPPIIRGPIGEFVEIVLAGLAQQEGENIFLRQTEAKIFNAKNGLRSAGQASFGYILENKKMKKVDAEAAIIKKTYRMFNKFFREDRSLDEIVSLVRAQFSDEKDKEKITKEFVEVIIPRPIHKGTLVQYVAGEKYTADVEKADIVNKEVWKEANEKLMKVSPHLYEEKEKKESYPALLGEKIVCMKCSDLTSDPQTLLYYQAKTVNYACENKECKQKKHRLEDFDGLILNKVLDHFKEIGGNHKVLFRQLIEHHFLFHPRKEKAALMDELLALEKQIKQALEMVLTNGNDKSSQLELETLITEYKGKHEKLAKKEKQMYHLEQAINGNDLEQVVEELCIEHLDHEQKSHLLSSVQLVYLGEKEFKIIFADGVHPNERKNES
jgi:site-specific DNA recombinase